MQNTNKDSNDIFFAVVVGGILGAAGASIFFATRKRAEPPLNSLGRVMVQIGELLDEPQFSHTHAVKEAEKKMDKYEDTVSEVISIIAAGMKLWERMKKGA